MRLPRMQADGGWKCRYPACMRDDDAMGGMRCRGKAAPPNRPLNLATSLVYDDKGKQVKKYEAFERCPTMLVPHVIWSAIDNANMYLRGLLGDIEPSARFSEVVTMVSSAQDRHG